MAPALARILKNGHGIHLSSSPASATPDPEGRSHCSGELVSQMIDCGDLQKMLRNLYSAPFPLYVPANNVLFPHLHRTALTHDHASLLGLVSSSEGLGDSQQVASVFPGGADMFLSPERTVQEACLLHGGSAASECGPDGGDVTGSPPTLPPPPLLYHAGEVKRQGYSPVFATAPTVTQGKEAGLDCPPPSPLQPRCGKLNVDVSVVLHEGVRKRLSRQAGLQGRALKLQRRLQALLGEHAVRHCDQQLEGLKGHCQPGSARSVHQVILPQHVGYKAPDSRLDSAAEQLPFKELREFSRSSQAVLRGLQEALDSDATASSSSDEEQEVERINGVTKTAQLSRNRSSSSSSSRERQWLEGRAELGSRWSWLQLRLAELDGRIQQMAELHKHIRSTKGDVVLADSQPLTDTQIQRTLLREMAGLSCTALDADNEPCSPTRLLHNIERQSAQLNQIVNSLMSPLSFSPPSKQPNGCTGKKAFISSHSGDDAFMPGSQKRKRPGTRRINKADASFVCARTRPLVTHHRRKLFALRTHGPKSQQDSGVYASTSSSSLSSSYCLCRSSCDPLVVCSDLGCSFRRNLSSGTSSFTPLSSDTSPSQYLKSNPAREEWCQRPLVINVELFSPADHITHSSTPLHTSRKLCRQHARHRKSRVMGLSPIRTPGFALKGRQRRGGQRKRKRKHLHRLTGDEEDFLYQLCDTEDVSDEVLEQSGTEVSHKQTTQGLVRKRPGENVYNINNVVIPSSGAKVEKLQYKDIVTPRWQLVDTSLVAHNEEENMDKEEEPEEDLTEEVFAKRHLVLEQREKSHWAPWGKRQCCRHPKRSGGRLSGSGGGMCTSGEESSVELGGTQADTDEQQSSEEWLPETPWKRRVFPLDEDDEEGLFSDVPEEVRSVWSGLGSAALFTSDLSPAQSASATLPSGGQSNRKTPESS